MLTVGARALWRGLAVIALLAAMLALPVATASARSDNAPPRAADADISTAPDTAVTIDTGTLVGDPDGDPWTVVSAGPGKYGTVSIDGWRVTYRPEKGYVGSDAFAYTVDDGRGGVATATIRVTVDPDAAPPVEGKPQLISFDRAADLKVGTSEALGAKADSGLPVTFTTTTPDVCTLKDNVLIAVAAGKCFVTASQDGDRDWAPADPVTWTIWVTEPGSPDPRAQAIDFAQPEAVLAGDAFKLGTRASSGLDVVVRSETQRVCTVEGFTVITLAAGTCLLTATQDGDGTWSAADPVTRSVRVGDPGSPLPLPQSIDFVQPDPVTVGNTFAVGPKASSALAVVVTSETPLICTVEGFAVTTLAAGTCVLTATQSGDGTWAPAAPVSRSITVAEPRGPDPSPQTIDFHPADTVLGLTPAYRLVATSSSGLPLAFEVTAGDCALDDAALAASSVGTCTVMATQPGNGAYSRAEAVSADIRFVLPVDDTASTPGATAVLVDVLDNDPADVALDQVSPPAHGVVAVVDGQVRYTPGPAFRGTDTFAYTVTRGGRSAEASVTVTVDNQAPTLAGARLMQPASTETTVLLDPVDPNGDPVTLDAASPTGWVEASVTGHELTVTAGPAASGDVDIQVTASDGAGGSVEATVQTRITPLAPTHVRRTLADAGTTVRWRPAPTAGAVYETVLDGETLCRSTRTVCTSSRLAGPRAHVSVRTLGRDGTRSPRVDAPLVGHGRILLATIYFRTGSARLTDVDHEVLALAIRAIRQDGFGRVRLDGYTDSSGGRAFNRALSRRRTHAVASYLHDQGGIGSSRAWHGETDPAAPNSSRDGRSRNRRVEVVLTY